MFTSPNMCPHVFAHLFIPRSATFDGVHVDEYFKCIFISSLARAVVTLSFVADIVTKEKRSAVMAAVRSCGNRATELKLMALLRSEGVSGWRRHQSVPGLPDFVFRRFRVAVFVDGCFWHGCEKHCRMPKGNSAYWEQKISTNKARDRRVNHALSKKGWRVVRIWEHDLRIRPAMCLHRIVAALSKGRPKLRASSRQSSRLKVRVVGSVNLPD